MTPKQFWIFIGLIILFFILLVSVKYLKSTLPSAMPSGPGVYHVDSNASLPYKENATAAFEIVTTTKK